MGWLIVALGALATYGFFQGGQGVWSGTAAAATLVNFWSYGVMHNIALESAKQRPPHANGFSDEDLEVVPNWLTNINLGSAIAIVILLIWLGLSRWG